MAKEINHKDLLEYGTIVTDKEYAQDNQYIRICKIKYQNVIYHVRIENDRITKLTQWDMFPYNESPEDIQRLSQEELLDLFMFSGRDRAQNAEAKRVYWLCVYEINKRYGDEIEILEIHKFQKF